MCRSRIETEEVEGARSWETMWWPRKPQPPITRTGVVRLEDGVCWFVMTRLVPVELSIV